MVFKFKNNCIRYFLFYYIFVSLNLFYYRFKIFICLFKCVLKGMETSPFLADWRTPLGHVPAGGRRLGPPGSPEPRGPPSLGTQGTFPLQRSVPQLAATCNEQTNAPLCHGDAMRFNDCKGVKCFKVLELNKFYEGKSNIIPERNAARLSCFL